MRRIFWVSVLAGLLASFVLGFAPSAQAGTFHVTLTYDPSGTSHTSSSVTNVTSGAGIWTFSVKVTGKVSQFGRQIKDNSPGAGDICWGSSIRQPKGSWTDVSTFIAASAPDACGTQWPDPDATLAFYTYMQTSDPNAKVDIDVVYPDPVVALNGTAVKPFTFAALTDRSVDVWKGDAAVSRKRDGVA